MAAILIVVDAQRASARMVEMLRGKGHTARVESNGAAALLAAHEDLPALIIIDLMVPILDGQEVVQALRHDPHTTHIPVVVLTDRDDDRQFADALVNGANVYLAKPPDLAVLGSIVDRLLTLQVKDTAA